MIYKNIHKITFGKILHVHIQCLGFFFFPTNLISFCIPVQQILWKYVGYLLWIIFWNSEYKKIQPFWFQFRQNIPLILKKELCTNSRRNCSGEENRDQTNRWYFTMEVSFCFYENEHTQNPATVKVFILKNIVHGVHNIFYLICKTIVIMVCPQKSERKIRYERNVRVSLN